MCNYLRIVIIMALLLCTASLDNVPGSETGQELSSSHFDVPSVYTLQQSSILLLVGEGDLVLTVDLLVFGTVAVEQAFLLSFYVHQAEVRDLLLVGQNIHILDEFSTNIHAYFRDGAMAYTC
jgi:hypothetical protein